MSLTRTRNSNRPLVDKLFQHWKAVLVLILVLSFGMRVFRLDFHSLWYDELSTMSLLQPNVGSNALKAIINSTGSETLHPLYYLILSVWVKFAGNSVWALRFPSVVFGSCAVVVYAFLLYQVNGRKAFAFSLLMIISPFLVWYSRDARPYALIMLLTGLHMLFYLNLLYKPQSKAYISGFIITGILSIYSGIFIGMLLMAELAWSLFRRKPREIAAVVLVLLFASPLFWQGYRTFFLRTSGRYRPVPAGVEVARIIGFPQEFLVARSFGPTPYEVRRFQLSEVLREKSLEIGFETLAIICILASLAAGVRSCRKISASNEYNVRMIHALGFITVAVCLQAGVLIAITGFQMVARHIAFLFGPFFVLATYPIARNNGRLRKTLFVMSLLLLWTWSSANQLFNSSYIVEDFKNAAWIIENDEHNASQVVALCHHKGLLYYGVKKPLIYFMESPEVTSKTLKAQLKNDGNPVWLVLSRPWAYPNFHAEDLGNYFQVLKTKELPGISMWLLLQS